MEVLISEVQKRNVLWNKSYLRYKDRRTVDNEWDAIAKNIGISKEDAKKKWRNLRDQFSKEIKKIPKTKSGASQDDAAIYSGKWQYFSSLLFLKDTMTPRDTNGNLSLVLDNSTTGTEADNEVSDTEENDPEIVLNEPSSSSKHSPPRRKKKRVYAEENQVELKLLDIETKKLALLEAPEDENSLFFRSLLAFMRKLDPIAQLRVRTKFQEILLHEMELVQSEEIYLSSSYSNISASHPPAFNIPVEYSHSSTRQRVSQIVNEPLQTNPYNVNASSSTQFEDENIEDEEYEEYEEYGEYESKVTEEEISVD